MPEGPALYPGDPRVVEAWNARAKREGRTIRVGVVALAGLAAVAAAGELAPAWVALAALGAALVVYPLAMLGANGRAAQKPFDLFEKGVHGTERRRLLRFRRFAPFPEVVRGEAREAAPGKYHVALVLIDGTTLESVPGEVAQDAVAYLNERTGQQIALQLLKARGENAEQRHS